MIAIVLGPGRTGTTSIYSLIDQSDRLFVGGEKEGKYLLTGDDGAEFWHRWKRSKYPVAFECSPQNLLHSHKLCGVVEQYFDEFHMAIIYRNLEERFKSLYLHHFNSGRLDCSIDEFFDRCEAAKEANRFTSSDDEVYAALAEVEVGRVNALAQAERFRGVITVLEYDNLEEDFNKWMSKVMPTKWSWAALPQRNASLPSSSALTRLILAVYRLLRLEKITAPGFQVLKSYIKTAISANTSNKIATDLSDSKLCRLKHYDHTFREKIFSEFGGV